MVNDHADKPISARLKVQTLDNDYTNRLLEQQSILSGLLLQTNMVNNDYILALSQGSIQGGGNSLSYQATSISNYLFEEIR